MGEKIIRHDLRIDGITYDLLRAEAEREHRSVNAHITFILERHVDAASERKRVVRMEKAGLPVREATKQAMEG